MLLPSLLYCVIVGIEADEYASQSTALVQNKELVKMRQKK